MEPFGDHEVGFLSKPEEGRVDDVGHGPVRFATDRPSAGLNQLESREPEDVVPVDFRPPLELLVGVEIGVWNFTNDLEPAQIILEIEALMHGRGDDDGLIRCRVMPQEVLLVREVLLKEEPLAVLTLLEESVADGEVVSVDDSLVILVDLTKLINFFDHRGHPLAHLAVTTSGLEDGEYEHFSV